MESLKERDWSKINEILLELYTLESAYEIADKFLKLLSPLIIYDKAFLIMCDEDDKIEENNSAFINVSDSAKQSYIDTFYEIDYVKNITSPSKTTVFRDTDEIEYTVRSKTKIYREFLSPNNMEFGCGIVFVKKGRILGVLNLFRNIGFCDFTDRELQILEVLKEHITNIIYSLKKNSLTVDGRKNLNLDNLASYDLSKREIEIIELMLEGLSNQEIGDTLVISISTVKKHVYNIFTKLGINSRMQLLKAMDK